MKDHTNEFETNRQTWNQRVQLHMESEFYDMSRFRESVNSLNAYELQALGDVQDLRLLHLQCHFGQDSLSWAKRGARVTGVDISDAAIAAAQQLSEELQLPADFVCCNVLDTRNHVQGKFDVVFSSYGTIGWLPDLKPWAQMVSEMLAPAGRFYLIEFHPVAWMFDYQQSPPALVYPYDMEGAIYEEYTGSYAAPDAAVTSKEYGWNHSVGQVVQNLIDAGLQITQLQELHGSPYDVFPDMELRDDGLYYLKSGLYPTLLEVMAKKPV